MACFVIYHVRFNMVVMPFHVNSLYCVNLVVYLCSTLKYWGLPQLAGRVKAVRGE